jgi:hypothetical protein
VSDEMRGALVAIVTAILAAPQLAEVSFPNDYSNPDGRDACRTRRVVIVQSAMDQAEQIVGDALEGALEEAA